MKKQSQKTLWTQVVKTGIIKSNLIPMAAGLILLYIVSPLASLPVFLDAFFYVIP